MALQVNRLSPARVKNETLRGLYADGNGLYLQVSAYGTKLWIFRFSRGGKSRQMGLGGINVISLAEAREEAVKCRKLLRDGIDPIEARKQEKTARQIEAAKALTFREAAREYIRSQSASWKSPKSGQQWRSSLENYVYPIFGDLPVSAVDTGLVTQVLTPTRCSSLI